MTTPSKHHAVVFEQTGGTDVLQYRSDWPVPVPKEGQVLVRNTCIGVNYVDTYFRSGLYPADLPSVPGREAVGTVVALGPGLSEDVDLKVGDRVVWLGSLAYAEYSAVRAAKVVRLPDGLEDDVAASAFLNGLTALALVRESYAVKKGDWVLVHAAAGSVGLLLVQLLKKIGAKVIATVGSPEKERLVKEKNADHVINYRTEEGKSWAQIVHTITAGNGVDVVYDSVGKDTWQDSLAAVRRKGTVVWFGNASGPVPPFTLHTIAPKCVKIVRPTLMGYIETAEEFRYYSRKLFELLVSGELHASIYKVYSLAQAKDAHKDIESRNTSGKLILKPEEFTRPVHM